MAEANPDQAASPAVAVGTSALVMRLGFIGAGRVGTTLALALQAMDASSFKGPVPRIQAVFSTRVASVQAFTERLPSVQACTSAQAVVDACDLVWLTVPDDAIAPTCSALRWRAGQLVLHTSGATELNALNAAVDQGARVAGFHPLHTFGDVDTALTGLPGCTVAVEASNAIDRSVLLQWAQALGARPFELPPGARMRYHASAHYAGAFAVALMREATALWQSFGVDETTALQALVPLLQSTARAMLVKGLAPGMAGVVARGDVGVLQHHLQAVEAFNPEVAVLYRSLSQRNLALAQEAGRLSPDQLAAVAAVLGVEPSEAAPPPSTL